VFQLCSPVRLVNPSQVNNGLYDSAEIGPWTVWQGSLEAKVMIIGKDFGPVWYFRDNKGGDADDNRTNDTVIKDVRSLGIPIRHPSEKVRCDLLFFTNSVLCLPENITSDAKSMSFEISDDWVKTCAKEFLRDLIEIVAPQVIVTLGKEAFKSVAYAYDRHRAWGIRPGADFNLTKIVDKKPCTVDGNLLVFPTFHPSYRHITRPAPKNSKDWAAIKEYLDKLPQAARA